MTTEAVFTEKQMLTAMDNLDLIQTFTGIQTSHRARIWKAVEDPQDGWIGAQNVKITPVRTLGAVVRDRAGQKLVKVPSAQDILDALSAVATPQEATKVDAEPSATTDL